jgi:hypothetical protein
VYPCYVSLTILTVATNLIEHNFRKMMSHWSLVMTSHWLRFWTPTFLLLLLECMFVYVGRKEPKGEGGGGCFVNVRSLWYTDVEVARFWLDFKAPDCHSSESAKDDWSHKDSCGLRALSYVLQWHEGNSNESRNSSHYSSSVQRFLVFSPTRVPLGGTVHTMAHNIWKRFHWNHALCTSVLSQ